MANARTRALIDMSTHDLEDELGQAGKELLNLRFQYVTRQNDNYARFPILRRDIARIKTILRERELEESEA